MFLQIRFRSKRERLQRRTARNSAQFLVRDREVRSVIGEFVRQFGGGGGGAAIEAPASEARKPSGALRKSRIGGEFRDGGRITESGRGVGISGQFPDQFSDDEGVGGEVGIGGGRGRDHGTESGIEVEGPVGKGLVPIGRLVGGRAVVELRKLNFHGGRKLLLLPCGHGRMQKRWRDSSSVEEELIVHQHTN